ncbi:MAG: glycosyltransferase family 2 protein [Elusimicrobia bacterium]|nr:glycosyltransferase family 2 protein [Elusimicrobiota bacterium]
MAAFSIVVPTYNRARMLRTALKTVQFQTFEDWECLVTDDGSKDDTPEVAKAFSKDPRFKFERFSKNQGMNAARNAALARATGKYVTFLDSDDLWLPNRLEAFARRGQEMPEAGFLFSNAYLWRFDRVVGLLFDPKREIPEGKVPGHYAVGEKHLPYVTTNVTVSREALNRAGGFEVALTTDTDLWAKIIAGGAPVAAIREPLSIRRTHGGQLSSKYVSNYDELMTAVDLASSDEATRKRLREDMVFEVATYLIKSAQPEAARKFMLDKLGDAAKGTNLFKLTYVPAGALKLGRGVREAWLRARHAPAFASREVREVTALIRPLLEAEGPQA